MSIYKNVASQKIAVYAHDTAADAPKTGDAANITAQITKDFGTPAATNDTNPTELDSADHPGIYVFDLTQAETNAEVIILSAVSGTADIQLEPLQIFTSPPSWTSLGITEGKVAATIAAGDIANNAITAAAIAAGAIDAATFAADVDAEILSYLVDDATRIDASALNTAATAVGSNGAGLTEAGGDGDHLTAINLPNQTMDIVGNITGNLTGSVGSVTGAVGSVTAGVTLANDAITAAKFDESTAFPLTASDTGSTAVARTGADADTLETLSDQINLTATQTSVNDLPTNAELATALGTADDAVLAQVALVKAKTDLIPADPADASDIASAFGTVNSTLSTIAGYIDTEVASILSAVDTEVAAIKAKTDNLPASPAATGDIPTVSQIWTTALTEAYRATGATGTAAQLLYELLANLTDFSISSTTKTARKLDGTTAKTYTLNDGVSPTAITEAT